MMENATEMENRDSFYTLSILIMCIISGVIYNPLFSGILFIFTIASAILPDVIYGKCWIIVTLGGKSNLFSRIKHAYPTKIAKIVYLAPIVLSLTCIFNLIYVISKIL